MSRTGFAFTAATLAIAATVPSTATAYYHAQFGRFLNRDPIGYRAGDANVYRYVGNRPTGSVDPSGLYDIEWEQVEGTDSWEGAFVANKNTLLRSFDRVEVKLSRLLAEMHKERNGMSPCVRILMDLKLAPLKGVLLGMQQGLRSESENLELYHYDFRKRDEERMGILLPLALEFPEVVTALDKDDDTPARHYEPVLTEGDEIHFNDNPQGSPWFNLGPTPAMANPALDALLFHELSRIYMGRKITTRKAS